MISCSCFVVRLESVSSSRFLNSSRFAAKHAISRSSARVSYTCHPLALPLFFPTALVAEATLGSVEFSRRKLLLNRVLLTVLTRFV
jgi:hypothetical protein